MLLQSGLNENWLADSMECYCYLRNIQDRFSDEEKHLARGVLVNHSKGICRFGSLVEYHPIFTKVQSSIRQFGQNVLP